MHHRCPRSFRMFAAAVAFAGPLVTAGFTHAGTTYVFIAGGETLVAEQTAAIAARSPAGNSIVYVTPANANSQTINGTALRFAGYEVRPAATLEGPTAGVARFQVLGNLNAGATDRILAFGGNLMSLDVGGHATFADGFAFDASATGVYGGAGAGSGGTALPKQIPDYTARPLGPSVSSTDGRGGRSAAAAGQAGSAAVNEYVYTQGGSTFSLTPAQVQAGRVGTGGTTGQGDYRTRGGAAGGLGGIGPDPARAVIPAPGGASTNADRGNNGANGATGAAGREGEVGRDGSLGGYTTVVSGVNALRAGSGGGAGASGGNGLYGNYGGGGGGGSASVGRSGTFTPFILFASGGDGGTGGQGGAGGGGGFGGNGGGGGGGIEIIARGSINAGADTQFLARGAGGIAGQAGGAGRAGSGGTAGAEGESNFILGLFGGNGGSGGSGGTGGLGGSGGSGAGGSGGNIHLIAARQNFTAGGPAFDLRGGGSSAGGSVNRQAYSGAGTGAGTTNAITNNSVSGINPYRSRRTDAETSPNIADLVGGGALYGIVADAGTDTPRTSFYDAEVAKARVPSNAVAVVTRQGSEALAAGGYSRYEGGGTFTATTYRQDALTMTALRDVKAPAVRAFDQNDSFNRSFLAENLRQAGWANDPTFNPTATGPVVLGTLSARNTFATLIDADVPAVFPTPGGPKVYGAYASFTPYTTPRQFKLDAIASGGSLYLTDNGLLRAQIRAVTPSLLPGITPPTYQTLRDVVFDEQNSVQVSDVYYVRAGTTRQLEFTATNVGNAGSMMPGFTQIFRTNQSTSSRLYTLDRDESDVRDITLSGGRGTSETINAYFGADYDDLIGSAVYIDDLSVKYVGPNATAANATAGAGPLKYVFTLPTVQVGQSATASLALKNDVVDDTNTALDDLRLFLNTLTLTGPDASAFQYLSPRSAVTVEASDSYLGTLGFVPQRQGAFTALLTIPTDQNAPFASLAALGGGDALQIELRGFAVPEPASLAVLAGGVALLARRRRR